MKNVDACEEIRSCSIWDTQETLALFIFYFFAVQLYK